MGGSGIKLFETPIGQYGQAAGGFYNTAAGGGSDIGAFAGSNMDFAKQLQSQYLNMMPQLQQLSAYLTKQMGQGPSIRQKEMESQYGQQFGSQSEKAINQLREGAYSGNTRGNVNLLSDFLTPMMLGQSQQGLQAELANRQLGQGAAGALAGLPSAYNATLAPSQQMFGQQNAQNTLDFQRQLANITNRFQGAGGLFNLAQLFKPDAYMTNDPMSQILEALLGSLISGAGKAVGGMIAGPAGATG